MARRSSSNHISPRIITVVVDEETVAATIHIEQAGPNLYQYSISYKGEWRTNTESLMPSTWHCEESGKRDLFHIALEMKKKKPRS